MSEPLRQELTTFYRELPNLLGKAGKFALVQGDRVEGVWDTYADAIQEGYRRFGLTAFLVKRIATTEPVYHFTRSSPPVCQAFTSN